MNDHTHESHDHHHEESFVRKYLFSLDHKMIGKQFLIFGLDYVHGRGRAGTALPVATRLARQTASYHWGFQSISGRGRSHNRC